MPLSINLEELTMASPKTSLVSNSGSKPSIGLENLPREIRDQIYGYVLGGSCCPDRSPYDRHDYPAAYKYPEHELFQISKRVRYDALELCFSKVEFCWRLKPEHCWGESYRNLGFSTKRLLDGLPTDRLMNIRLVLDMGAYLSLCYGNGDVRCDFLKNFGGVQILRKRMRMSFKNCSMETHQNISIAFFQALTTMTGFQTVVVEISMADYLYKALDLDHARKLSDGENLQMAARDVLEPALGPAKPSTVKYDSAKHGCARHGWMSSAELLCLEFHPRQHLVKLQGTETAGVVEHHH